MSTIDSGHCEGFDGATSQAALDGRREAVDLFADDCARGFGCADSAALCAEFESFFKWLRDPRYKPDHVLGDDVSIEEARFLPVEIIDGDDGSGPDAENPSVVVDVEGSEYDGVLEVDLAYGPRLRVRGAYDVEALALLIRRLSA